MKTPVTHSPTIVSRQQWLAARMELLRQEKDFNRQRDALAAKRRALPWVKIDTPYVFDSGDARVSLADLFNGRSQLLIYHFMLGPGWEEGCRACSFVSDHFDGALPHLAACDVNLVVVSSAPLAEILAYKKRMGWSFPWVSSFGTTFNHDFHVGFTQEEITLGLVDYNYALKKVGSEELPGLSAFARDVSDSAYHTYSTYARGLDLLIGTYNLLDLAPRGRGEEGKPIMHWVRHHDRYPSV